MTGTKPQTPKKVLYVITKSSWGGATRYVHDMAQEAHRKGYRVTVAAGGDGELFDRLEKDGIRSVPIAGLTRDVSLLREWRALRELSGVLKEMRPDVVHVNSSKGGLAVLASRLHGVRHVIFTVHGWALNEARPLWQKVLIWFAYYLTLLLSHTVIVVSHAARTQIYFPFLGSKMRVIHNGLKPFPLLTREEARAKLYPKSPNAFWIGAIAELHPIKGLPTLIEAYQHLMQDVPDSELVMVGEGELRAKLERQIHTQGVSKQVHLLGQVENARSYLKAFDVLVLPSRSEGLAYVLLEAGIAGIPVIATAVGGIPEVIEDGETGILVPYGDRKALTEALLRVQKDPKVREMLALNLQEKVREKFSIEHMVTKTLTLY